MCISRVFPLERLPYYCYWAREPQRCSRKTDAIDSKKEKEERRGAGILFNRCHRWLSGHPFISEVSPESTPTTIAQDREDREYRRLLRLYLVHPRVANINRSLSIKSLTNRCQAPASSMSRVPNHANAGRARSRRLIALT